MADPMGKTIVEAQQFVLRDADGNVSGRLGTKPGEGPVLQLYSGGVPRLVLAAGRDGPAVMLADGAGKPLAVLSYHEGGTMLELHTASGNASMAICATSDGAGVVFPDPDGKLAVVVSVSKGGLHVSTREAGGALTMPLATKLVQ